MITVIIPNYNGSSFLREAIDSALVEQGVELEVIVVDDGSTDGSRQVIESYGDRIRPIFQKNQGACAARNTGLAMAQGEWIKFLDSDDRLLADSLRTQLAETALLVAEYGDACLVYGNGSLIDQAGEVITPLYFTAIKDGAEASAEDIILRSPLISMPLHRRSLLQHIGGFDERIPAGQEYDLHLRLFLSGVRFIYKPTVCFQYRRHASASRISIKMHSVESFNQRYAAYQRQIEMAEKFYGHDFPASVKKAFSQILWSTGRFALRCDQAESARRYFSKARELAPTGGIPGGWGYQIICRLLGPVLAERIGMFLRIFSKS